METAHPSSYSPLVWAKVIQQIGQRAFKSSTIMQNNHLLGCGPLQKLRIAIKSLWGPPTQPLTNSIRMIFRNGNVTKQKLN